MKKVFLGVIFILSFISLANANEVDILANLTKGKISDTSAGVKVLSLDEEKEVVGGYKVGSASWRVNTYITKPLKNNYNANTKPQTSSQKIYSNHFMKWYLSTQKPLP